MTALDRVKRNTTCYCIGGAIYDREAGLGPLHCVKCGRLGVPETSTVDDASEAICRIPSIAARSEWCDEFIAQRTAEGATAREIGREIGLSPGAVRVRRHRLRAARVDELTAVAA